MKKLFALLLSVVMILSLVACGSEESKTPNTGTDGDSGIPTMNLMIGHTDAEDMTDPLHVSCVVFAEKLEEYSGGKITAKVYPNAQLGDERSMAEQVQNGTIDACIITSGVASNFNELARLTDLPYLFDNLEQARAVLDSEIIDAMAAGFEPQGLKCLGYTENGFRYWLSNTSSVKIPNDLVGEKYRVIQSPVYLDFYKAINSNAIAMAYGEVYTGLSQGAIDGFDLTLPLIISSRFYEVTKYITDGRYTYTAFPVLVNLDKWNSWSPEVQDIFMKAAADARQASYENNDEVAKTGIQTLIDNGIQFTAYEEVDTEAFKSAATPTWENYTKDNAAAKEIVDRILEMNNAG